MTIEKDAEQLYHLVVWPMAVTARAGRITDTPPIIFEDRAKESALRFAMHLAVHSAQQARATDLSELLYALVKGADQQLTVCACPDETEIGRLEDWATAVREFAETIAAEWDGEVKAADEHLRGSQIVEAAE